MKRRELIKNTLLLPLAAAATPLAAAEPEASAKEPEEGRNIAYMQVPRYGKSVVATQMALAAALSGKTVIYATPNGNVKMTKA